MKIVWFITGSSRGLGRGHAEAVLELSDWLVATSRKPEDLQDLTISLANGYSRLH
ncbi:hypothetical protein [Spirosoma sp. KNUC1025]|uniref:hypothetical protein n=1 Tax=Spirosoma sp. KNUC1025 TaxID=2894082 RepID=UPI00386A622F|nr:hypothetical protein LN737_27555 [Spirosoma sp. KNUC1025]